jgi:hypothetical protein
MSREYLLTGDEETLVARCSAEARVRSTGSVFPVPTGGRA